MAYQVFISHSSQDAHLLQAIRGVCASVPDLQLYHHERDVQPGTPIADKLKAQIRASNLFVVLLTRNAEASPYVQQEIGFAEAQGKPIVPIVERGVEASSLAMLEGREYVSLDPNNPGQAMLDLKDCMYRHKEAMAKGQRNALGVLAALLGIIVLFSGSEDES